MAKKRSKGNGAITRHKPVEPNEHGHSDRAAELKALADRVVAAHGEYVTAFKKALPHAIETGTYLLQCYEIVGWGKWGKWVADNLPGIHPKTVQRYKRLAEYKDFVLSISDNLSELNMGQADVLIGWHIRDRTHEARAKQAKKTSKLATSDPSDWLLSNLTPGARKLADEYIERDRVKMPWETADAAANADFLALPENVQTLINSYQKLLEVEGQEAIDCFWGFMSEHRSFREMMNKMDRRYDAEVGIVDDDTTMVENEPAAATTH